MLLPRFSIRWLLVLTTAFGVFFTILSIAVRGQAWAIAISVAIASLGVFMLIYAGVFVASWWISLAVEAYRPSRGPTNPFAEAKPPPQLISPEDPE